MIKQILNQQIHYQSYRDLMNRLFGKGQENNCPICLLPLDPAVQPIRELPCGHLFHSECIQEWQKTLQVQGRAIGCPNCRKVFSEPRVPRAEGLDIGMYQLQNRQALLHFLHEQFPEEEFQEQRRYECQQIVCLLIVAAVSLLIETVVITAFLRSLQQFLKLGSNLPFFSTGVSAKGYIAIGMFAEGVIAIGMMSQGLFTLSMVGVGLLFFVGQVGVGLGFGIYQIGISWYCHLAQLSIGIWKTKHAQIRISLLSPVFNNQGQHCETC